MFGGLGPSEPSIGSLDDAIRTLLATRKSTDLDPYGQMFCGGADATVNCKGRMGKLVGKIE